MPTNETHIEPVVPAAVMDRVRQQPGESRDEWIARFESQWTYSRLEADLELLPADGQPLCEQYMFQAVKHLRANCEFDGLPVAGHAAPGIYSGSRIAKLVNVFADYVTRVRALTGYCWHYEQEVYALRRQVAELRLMLGQRAHPFDWSEIDIGPRPSKRDG